MLFREIYNPIEDIKNPNSSNETIEHLKLEIIKLKNEIDMLKNKQISKHE